VTEQSRSIFQIKDVDGTSDRTFHVTGVGDHWHSNETEGQEDVFTKDDFEGALRKVSRKRNLPIGENIRDAVRSIKGQK